MYEQANERINEGLSFGARLMLGVVAALFGIIMFLIANPEHREGFYAFGAFCMLIAIACFTKGRVRQFIGSLVGSTIFLVGVWYLAVELREGNLWSGVSSAFNAHSVPTVHRYPWRCICVQDALRLPQSALTMRSSGPCGRKFPVQSCAAARTAA